MLEQGKRDKKPTSSEPRSAHQSGSLPSRPNEEEQDEATSPQYSYTTPVEPEGLSEPFEPPDQSITPTLQRPYPSDGRLGLSGLPGQLPASNRPPVHFGYQAAQFGLSAPSGYEVAPPLWTQPSGLTSQYPGQPGQYDDSYGSMTSSRTQEMYGVPSSSQNAISHFRSRNTAPVASMAPGSYYQNRTPAESTRPSEDDNRWEVPTPQIASPGAPWQRSSPAGQNANIQYQSPATAPGQTAPSGFELNAGPASEILSYVPNYSSLPREPHNYFPAAKGSGSRSINISYLPRFNSGTLPSESEISASYEDGRVDDITNDMENSTLTTHSHDGSQKGRLFYQLRLRSYINLSSLSQE